MKDYLEVCKKDFYVKRKHWRKKSILKNKKLRLHMKKVEKRLKLETEQKQYNNKLLRLAAKEKYGRCCIQQELEKAQDQIKTHNMANDILSAVVLYFIKDKGTVEINRKELSDILDKYINNKYRLSMFNENDDVMTIKGSEITEEPEKEESVEEPKRKRKTKKMEEARTLEKNKEK